MILRELFEKPIIPKVASKSFPGHKYYEFSIEDRLYEIRIKTSKLYEKKTYTIDYFYLGTADLPIHPDKSQNSTGIHKDAYKVLSAVIYVVRDFFKDGKMGYNDVIIIEPNSGSKEKLYRVFAERLAGDLGLRWRFNEAKMRFEISGHFG